MHLRIVVVLAVLVASCGGGAVDGSTTSTTTVPTVSPTTVADPDSDSAATTAAPTTTTTGSSTTVPTEGAEPAGGCADVVGATVESDGNGTFSVSVTVRSPDTGWDKYADFWVVLVDDREVARRVLTHPHVDEQPFTRSVQQVALDDNVSTVTIRANDSVEGLCGATFEAAVDR